MKTQKRYYGQIAHTYKLPVKKTAGIDQASTKFNTRPTLRTYGRQYCTANTSALYHKNSIRPPMT